MNPIAFLLHDYITQVIKTNYSTTDSSHDQRQKTNYSILYGLVKVDVPRGTSLKASKHLFSEIFF